MDLSVTTDYATSTGDPAPWLRQIAAAGFTHVHWCHQWNTDYLYGDDEIAGLGREMSVCGLRLLDLHGSVGPTCNWTAADEVTRQAGVALVRNRMAMTSRLGGDVVVMHIPAEPACTPLRVSLDALRPWAAAHGVRLAIENGGANHAALQAVFEAYEPGYVGLCYDCGHGNVAGDGLDFLERVRHRLIAVHLHDNDGRSDQHRIPFTGTVDWPRLARLMAASAYAKCVSLEVSMRHETIRDPEPFLHATHAAAVRLTAMIAAAPR